MVYAHFVRIVKVELQFRNAYILRSFLKINQFMMFVLYSKRIEI